MSQVASLRKYSIEEWAKYNRIKRRGDFPIPLIYLFPTKKRAELFSKIHYAIRKPRNELFFSTKR
jgi:hypothetical protein